MIKLIIIVLFILLFIGCDMMQDTYNYSKFDTMELHHDDYTDIDNYIEVSQWINDRVQPRPDKVDVWSAPATTISRGWGDCDDFSILFLNIVFIRFGIKGNLIALDYDNMYRTVVEGGSINHIIVEIEGRYYDPFTGLEYNVSKVGYIYIFNELFK